MKNFPPNPMLIHSIQDGLLKLKGANVLEIALYKAAQNRPDEAVKLAISCHHDNPEMMQGILGHDLLSKILQYHNELINQAEPENGAYSD